MTDTPTPPPVAGPPGPARRQVAFPRPPLGHTFTDLDDALRRTVLDRIQGEALTLDVLPPRWQHLVIQRIISSLEDPPSQETDILWACVLGANPGNKKALDHVLNTFRIHLMPSADAHDLMPLEEEASIPVPKTIITREGWTYTMAFEIDGEIRSIALGAGSSASVFLVEDDDGSMVVAKVVSDRRRNTLLHFFLEYLKNLRFADEPSIIQTYDAGRYRFDGGTAFFMIQEYGGDSLAKEIRERTSLADGQPPYTRDEKRTLARQLLAILRTLRRHCTLHLDIKPHNLFNTHDGLKIGDFGVAQFLPPGEDHVKKLFRGTPGYTPRQSFDGHFDYFTDLFGFARTLADLSIDIADQEIFGSATYEQIITWQRHLKSNVARDKLIHAVELSQKNVLSKVITLLSESPDRLDRFILVPILWGDAESPGTPRTIDHVEQMLTVIDALDAAATALATERLSAARQALEPLLSAYHQEPWYALIYDELTQLWEAATAGR